MLSFLFLMPATVQETVVELRKQMKFWQKVFTQERTVLSLSHGTVEVATQYFDLT